MSVTDKMLVWDSPSRCTVSTEALSMQPNCMELSMPYVTCRAVTGVLCLGTGRQFFENYRHFKAMRSFPEL